MSCLSGLDSQIATLLAVPHEILLLRHRVFREYAKIAVGTEFVHTMPSFLIIMAAALVLWRHPPSSTRLLDLLGATLVYKSFQVQDFSRFPYDPRFRMILDIVCVLLMSLVSQDVCQLARD
jgi:hypothetical protein